MFFRVMLLSGDMRGVSGDMRGVVILHLITFLFSEASDLDHYTSLIQENYTTLLTF